MNAWMIDHGFDRREAWRIGIRSQRLLDIATKIKKRRLSLRLECYFFKKIGRVI